MIELTPEVEVWFRAHDAYHKASSDYNDGIELAKKRGNWGMIPLTEYDAITETYREALKADLVLYKALRDRKAETNLY